MILTHLDNLKLLLKADPAPHGMGFSMPIDFIRVRTDPLLPATRKTGKLIWPRDPFVTYEESDRSWGVALGIAEEEEEPLFYDLAEFQPIMDEMAAESSRRFMEDFEQAMVQHWNIPPALLCESNLASNYRGPFLLRDMTF